MEAEKCLYLVAEELDSMMLEAPFTFISSPVSFASEQALQVCMLVLDSELSYKMACAEVLLVHVLSPKNILPARCHYFGQNLGKQTAVFCKGDNGTLFIHSNRATKYTGNQHENFR